MSGWPRWAVLFGLLALAIVAGVALGSVGLSVHELSAALTGSGDNPALQTIVWDIRIPRTLLVIGSSASLALAGLILQTYFANPMADSYVVGVSSGAALGAVIALLGGLDRVLPGGTAVPIAAFIGAMGTLLIVWRLASRGGVVRMETLLLTGIAISLLYSSLTSLLMIRSEDPLHGVLFWLLGSFSTAAWNDVWWMYATLAVCVAGTVWWARDLNAMLWGDETAAGLGVEIGRVRGGLLVIAALLTAVSVALNGVITFVGLIVPHIARPIFGADHRVLIPAVALIGAILLLASDVAARLLMAPAEMPIGVVTAVIGVPFFLALLRKTI